jgi:transcriptional regulator with XRE-family HTH domain
MTTNINVGTRVKQLREQARLNQTQIAAFLGVDQSYVSKCEKGERQFNVDLLEKLCNLFGCALPDLLNGDAQIETLNVAFRAEVIAEDDLVAIADIHKIVLNIREMKKLLGG